MCYVEKPEQALNRLALNGSANLAIVVSGADHYVKGELSSAMGLKLTLDQPWNDLWPAPLLLFK